MAEDWSEWENDLVIQAYMEMVACDMRDERLSKVSVYRAIAVEVGRPAKAVEFKFLNVSGVLRVLGLGHVPGLKPYGNFQEAMLPLVEKRLATRPELQDYLVASAPTEFPQMNRRREVEAPVEEGPPQWLVASRSNHEEEGPMKVQDLWHYATGGSDVAALPGHGTHVPVGPRPAGVDAAVEWMEQAFHPGYAGNRRMLFLVGGPGGGKSAVAAALVSKLAPTKDTNDGLAHRSYLFQSGGGPVLLVNDATIPTRTGSGSDTLAMDVTRADGHVVACVNRGVLVDEAVRNEGEGLGRAIANWLRGDSNRDAGGWTVGRKSAPQSFVSQSTFTGPDESVDAVAVFVDTCSLFEERPTVALVDGLLDAPAYSIERFGRGAIRNSTPAGKFLSTVANELVWDSQQDWDPIAANLESLRMPAVQDGMLSVLRAAEIASSQRFSYRQLWGVIARAVAGPLPESIKRTQVLQWLDSTGPAGQSDDKKRFTALRALASVRLHQALFGDDWASSSRHPILSLTAAIDPARDMVPGYPKQSSGWATPLSEAFAGGEPGGQPLQVMQSAANSEALSQYVTDFDEALDEAFVRAMQAESASAGAEDVKWRLQATSWYGRYLTRMLAVSHGIPAFESALSQWTSAWQLSPVLPHGLLGDLTTLFRPPRHPDNSDGGTQIPLFGSRAEALFGSPETPTLVAELAPMEIDTRRRGEELLLVVRQHDKEIGTVQLDLDLVREATAGGANWLGLTDATESVVPRLERFRSLSLTSANRKQNGIRLATRDKDYNLVAVPGEGAHA